MEVGKLVTSETCGNIFYFVIDETHPDEPQSDASRCYYVVAPATSTFSYREAYGVLCRALCGLENRTYLHRWHSLYEQIFGTTPYVEFVSAVRDSPMTQPNSFGQGSQSPPCDSHAQPMVTLPALFSDETTARLALQKAEKERQNVAEGDMQRQQKQEDRQHHQGALHGCSTPVHEARDTKGTSAPAPEGASNEVTRKNLADVKELASVQTQSGTPTGYVQDQTLSKLLNLASQWQESAAALRGEDRGTVAQLQRDLQEERRKRREAEELSLLQARALEEAHSRAKEESLATAAVAKKESAAVTLAAKDEAAALRRRVEELETQLAETQKRHTTERDRNKAEKEKLQEQLWQQSQAQGVQIQNFLNDNAGAVKRVEEALEKREKELCAVYTAALEERDVRIAQLSQEVLSHLHNTRQLTMTRSDQDRFQAERVAHLEDVASHLKEWNTALRRQLEDATEENRKLRDRLQVSNQSFEADRTSQLASWQGTRHTSPVLSSSSALHCSVCAGLPHEAAVQLATQLRQAHEQLSLAKADAVKKSEELERAALVIEQLTRGVRHAKTDVDSIWSRFATLSINPAKVSTETQNIV